MKPRPPQGRGTAAVAALLAFALFAGHALVFGPWIIDDAGITFAYARNLAEGYGLVAQPAAEPVEGASNALWTLILAATYFFGLFDPMLTPKLLGGLFVLISFLLLSYELIVGHRRAPFAVGFALAATAASTPFTLWTVSGLENALFVCLISVIAALALRSVRRSGAKRHDASNMAFVCFLLYLTRPDGAVYLPVVAFLMALLGAKQLKSKAAIQTLTFLVPWILVTASRLVYYGDVFPNTYYAKKGPAWRETSWLLDHLGTALGGTIFILVLALAIASSVLLAVLLGRGLRNRWNDKIERNGALLTLGALFLTAYAAFETLPTDWMPEYRFGTALFLLGPLLVVEVLGLVPMAEHRRRRLCTFAGAALLAAAGIYSWQHSRAFRNQPTVPLDEVRSLSIALDEFADRLGVDRATILLPDIGGSLWEDRFVVLDLAGLTDRTIGRSLRSDREAFVEYVLSRSPDVIWAHGYWLHLADLESIPAFERNYAAVSAESVLGREDGMVYVRKPDGESN